jgi:hypothetical protein
MNIPASKLRILEMCPQTQNGEFIEESCTILIEFK